MKTKQPSMVKNTLSLILSITLFLVVAFLIIFSVFHFMLIDGSNQEYVILLFLLTSPIVVVYSLIFWSQYFRVRLFDYEKKNNMIPLIDNKIVSPKKQDVAKIEWIKSKQFRGKLYKKYDKFLNVSVDTGNQSIELSLLPNNRDLIKSFNIDESVVGTFKLIWNQFGVLVIEVVDVEYIYGKQLSLSWGKYEN